MIVKVATGKIKNEELYLNGNKKVAEKYVPPDCPYTIGDLQVLATSISDHMSDQHIEFQ